MAMNLYITSGLLMLLGTYIILKYRPYCMLKGPELESAMALYKKKFLKEKLGLDGRAKYNNYYEGCAKKHKLGIFVLFIAIPVHLFIFFANSWETLTPLYYVSIVGLSLIFIQNSNPDPFCTRQKSLSDIMETSEDVYLKYIDVFQKHQKQEPLNEEEQRLFDDEKGYQNFFLFYVWGISTATVLHLLLDIWFFLNDGLMIG